MTVSTLGCGCDAARYGNLDMCKRCYMKMWRAANKERLTEYDRRRWREVPAVKEQARASRERNAERIRAQAAARRAADPEKYRARDRERYRNQDAAKRAQRYAAYYQATREQRIAYSRAYRDANYEAQRESVRRWRANNRDQVRLHNNERRARLHDATADLTPKEWRAIVAEFDGACAYCDTKEAPLVVEHMTPLSRGGNHTASNVVPACAPCNLRKHAKTAQEFAGWQVPPRRRS